MEHQLTGNEEFTLHGQSAGITVMDFWRWAFSDLIEITEDGIISREELPKLKEILEKLEKIAEIISEMKIAGEKYIKGE